MIVGRCSSKLSSHKIQSKSKKSQALSGARHRFIGETALGGAESKDPGGAYLAHAVQAFSTTEARIWRPRAGAQKEAQPHAHDHQVHTVGRSVLGLRWLKAPSGISR